MTDIKLFGDGEFDLAESGADLRAVSLEGERWYVATDIARILGFRDAKDATRRLARGRVRLLPVQTRGGSQLMQCVDKRSLRWLLARSKRPAAIDAAKRLGVQVDYAPSTSDSTLLIIAAAFGHLPIEPELRVGPYRVDLYLPSLRVAVECDELGHRHYDQAAESKRQAYLESELGCLFVRYDPLTPGFNIGLVINEILQIQTRLQMDGLGSSGTSINALGGGE